LTWRVTSLPPDRPGERTQGILVPRVAPASLPVAGRTTRKDAGATTRRTSHRNAPGPESKKGAGNVAQVLDHTVEFDDTVKYDGTVSDERNALCPCEG
jgi:hypothetical protein